MVGRERKGSWVSEFGDVSAPLDVSVSGLGVSCKVREATTVHCG